MTEKYHFLLLYVAFVVHFKFFILLKNQFVLNRYDNRKFIAFDIFMDHVRFYINLQFGDVLYIEWTLVKQKFRERKHHVFFGVLYFYGFSPLYRSSVGSENLGQ